MTTLQNKTQLNSAAEIGPVHCSPNESHKYCSERLASYAGNQLETLDNKLKTDFKQSDLPLSTGSLSCS